MRYYRNVINLFEIINKLFISFNFNNGNEEKKCIKIINYNVMSFTEWKTIKYVKHVADVLMAVMVRGRGENVNLWILLNKLSREINIGWYNTYTNTTHSNAKGVRELFKYVSCSSWSYIFIIWTSSETKHNFNKKIMYVPVYGML